MELEGYLLDSDYITVGGKALIRLWVKVGDETHIALDKRFVPYFYAVAGPKANVTSVCNEILTILRTHAANAGRDETAITCTAVRKKLFGVERDAVKVVVAHPQDVPRVRDEVRHVNGVESVNEADVLYGHRYLIDMGLIPLGKVKITGTKITAAQSIDGYDGRLSWMKNGIEIDTIEAVETDIYPDLRVLAFDIECYNPQKMPDPAKDPIIIISTSASDGETRVIHTNGGSEKKILQDFVNYVREYDPDIILTYNGNSFDWPYVMKRAEKHGVKLSIGRDYLEPQKRSNVDQLTILGRGNVDLYSIVMRDMQSIPIKTLKNVADFLGITPREQRVIIEGDQIAAYWDNEDTRDMVLEYAKDDAVSTLELGKRLLPIQYELSRMTRRPVDDTYRMGRGRQVEMYLMAEAHSIQELVPSKRHFGANDRYEGGFVLEPKRGIHENVICLDFASMYPNIMISYNISPDTLLDAEAQLPEAEYHAAPELGYRFKRTPDGFFKKILLDLVQTRKQLKRELKTLDAHDTRTAVLDVRQQTLKILTNSFYGYTGWNGAKWYRSECAEATAAWGRFIIKSVIERAKEWGFDVYYGDTDSIFASHSEKIPDFAKAINAEFPLDLEIETLYTSIFFTGKKKRYAGLAANGEITVRGLEVRRGDWCELAKKIQQQTIEIMLKQRDVKPAEKLIRETISKLEEGAIDIDELTIYKSLTRDPGDYKAKQAHVLAIEEAISQGAEFNIGEKVGYVVLKGSGKMSERAKLVSMLKKTDVIDYQYYIDKQILPAALRILEYFGTSENSLKQIPEQTGLDQWF